MKIFLSWSKERSRGLALALHGWSRYIIQALDPWMSDTEIQAGQRWEQELSSCLNAIEFGIICVTPENSGSPWLLFEAGALAKSVTQGRVVPLLLDMEPTDLRQPLAQFQAVKADREGIERLFLDVHRLLNPSNLSDGMVRDNIEAHWSKLEGKLGELNQAKTANGDDQVTRSDGDMLKEVLLIVRDLRREATPPPGSRASSLGDVQGQLRALTQELTYRYHALRTKFGANSPQIGTILDALAKEIEKSMQALRFIEGINSEAETERFVAQQY